MSTFFRALEQAEQDRIQGHAARRTEGAGPTGAAPVEAPPDRVTAEAPFIAREEAAPPSTLLDAEPEVAAEPMMPGERIDGHLVSLLDPTSFEAEQYRTLRFVVEQWRRTASHAVFAVSSPAVGDGKTTTAINLAGALAQAPESRVLLIDADLRRASVAERLGLREGGRRGLVQAIRDPRLTLEDVVQPVALSNLTILLAGGRPAAPYEVLKSPRLGELIEQARARYDYVVLDTPPVVSVPDCRVIGKWVDGFLVVVTAHQTPRKLLAEALNVLEPSKVLGLIFNGEYRSLASYGAVYGVSTDGERRPWSAWAGRAAAGAGGRRPSA
jgi:capsular exopolysaccharide synthesis family protein